MRIFAPRLFLLGAVLAALAMLTPGLARADDDDGGTGAVMDRAFCGSTGPLAFGQCFIPGFLDFDFEASSGPMGENPTGTFVFESLPSHWEGQVTCLQVTGTSAFVGGVITAGDGVGLGFVFVVVDNSPPTPDALGFDFVAPPAANTPNCGVLVPPFVDVTGDLVVQDNITVGGDDDDNGNGDDNGTADDDDDNGNGNGDDDDDENGNVNEDNDDSDEDEDNDGTANDDDDSGSANGNEDDDD
jgi:hypothetical protein